MIDQVLGANNPLPPLRSVGLLQQLSTDPAKVQRKDIIGLIVGGLLGWYIANRFPNQSIKLIGALVGAEIGLIMVQVMKKNETPS